MKKFVIVVFLLAVSVFQAYSQTPASDNPNAPEIKFNKTTHDYGTLYQGGDANCEFIFTNTGKEPLVITSVRSSCGCTVPSYTNEPVMPGKTGSIKVKYDSNRIGPISRQITVVSNAKTSTVVLTITGKVIQKPTEISPFKQLDENASPVAK